MMSNPEIYTPRSVNGRVDCRVNMNRSDAKKLRSQWLEVALAAQALEAAIANAAPHGRDYQTQPSDTSYRRDAAMNLLMRRFANDVNRYAMDSALFIDEQGNSR